MNQLNNNQMISLSGGDQEGEFCSFLGGAAIGAALTGGGIWVGIAFLAICLK